MRRFVEGIDRGQAALFPECLADWVNEGRQKLVQARAFRLSKLYKVSRGSRPTGFRSSLRAAHRPLGLVPRCERRRQPGYTPPTMQALAILSIGGTQVQEMRVKVGGTLAATRSITPPSKPHR